AISDRARSVGRRSPRSRGSTRVAIIEGAGSMPASEVCDGDGRSALRLRVVLLAQDALALAILGALDPALFLRAHMAVAAGRRFLAIDTRLAALELGHLAIRERTVLDAAFDALLLIDVALHIGLHALRRGRQRIAI